MNSLYVTLSNKINNKVKLAKVTNNDSDTMSGGSRGEDAQAGFFLHPRALADFPSLDVSMWPASAG